MDRKPYKSYAILFVLLIASISASGCVILQLIESQVATAYWHQPELWDVFPTEDTGVYDILDLESYRRSHKRDGEKFLETLSITENGDVRYSLSVKPSRLSSAQNWDHMKRTFDALSLPPPSLDFDFVFSYRGSHFFTKWLQPGVWDAFPDGAAEGGFKLWHHESLKVAEEIGSWESYWVRADDAGNVSFRMFVREGWYAEQQQLSKEAGEPLNLSELVHGRMIDAFQALALPEPELDWASEFTRAPWGHLDAV